MSDILWPEIYKKLGVKPVINAKSWVTRLGGSLMPREVLSAMEDASKSFIDIVELHKAAGKVIANICKAESGLVTSGCAAGQVLMSAACITGTDKKIIGELPNPSTLKKEILIFKGQRNHYDRNLEMTGAILKEFGEEERVFPEDLYENIYWKKGAVDTKTNEKTLTLKQFEYRYTPRFMRIANEVKGTTVYEKYLHLPEEVKNNSLLIKAMRELDVNANINWNLMHMGAAYKHLSKKDHTIDATGGTNWKEYLPPSFQKIIFFPELWSDSEKADWGKQWVEHMFNPQTH